MRPEHSARKYAGVFGGKNGRAAGDATNVVTDYAHIKGESRSPNADFATAITAAYREAFAKAATKVKDDSGMTADVKFDSQPEYTPFRLAEDAAVVQYARRAAESIGLTPTYLFSNGGLDANWFVKHGLPTVTIGSGQFDVHTVKKYVDLAEFANGCRLAVALATLEG